MSTAGGKKNIWALTLGSVGVVYGDIGTSPLYAFRESLMAAANGGVAQPAMILGVLSLILWALIVIVTLKYVALLLRADNHGEGGILTLMALAQQALGRRSAWVMLLGITGASLFYGDAIITPAISVLSALEGLKLATPVFEPYIIPIALSIMVALFAVQRRGTATMGRFFGPIMVVWFGALALGGLAHIQDSPDVWQAFNPAHAWYFITHHGWAGFIALGAVFLAVTGAEALYADLGHFGKRPIRLAWLLFVMPSLALNYLGQGALVLKDPETAEHAFYLLYPQHLLLPMVALATLASIIASQAVITGAFSLTHQAVQLSLLPRLRVLCTAQEHRGQIYMPQVNWVLFAGVIVLIETFRSSSNLASAYGIAVTGTMIITATLLFVVMRHRWKWPRPVAIAIITPLLAIDFTFFAANLTKLLNGGFLPLLLAGVLVLMMRTWVRGSRTLHESARGYHNTMESLIRSLKQYPTQRVDGTAIYLSSNTDYAPSALLHNLKHNKVLHRQNILLTLRFDNVPFVDDAERIQTEAINADFMRMTMRFGFMETPNVTRGLNLLRNGPLKPDMMLTSFFISRRHIMPSAKFGMPLWQDRIFIAMNNSASDAASYFHLPRSRVVELGVQMTV